MQHSESSSRSLLSKRSYLPNILGTPGYFHLLRKKWGGSAKKSPAWEISQPGL